MIIIKKKYSKSCSSKFSHVFTVFSWLWAWFPGPLLSPHPAQINNKQINISKVLVSDAAQFQLQIKGTLPAHRPRAGEGPGTLYFYGWKLRNLEGFYRKQLAI